MQIGGSVQQIQQQMHQRQDTFYKLQADSMQGNAARVPNSAGIFESYNL